MMGGDYNTYDVITTVTRQGEATEHKYIEPRIRWWHYVGVWLAAWFFAVGFMTHIYLLCEWINKVTR